MVRALTKQQSGDAVVDEGKHTSVEGVEIELITSSRLSRHSKKILGRETFVDDNAQQRITWAQRGLGIFSLIGIICYIAGWYTRNFVIQMISIVLGAMGLGSFPYICYKNTSFIVVKRLLKEPNVIIIVALTLFNLAIDIGRPQNPFSPIYGLIYLLITNLFIFTDALISKSRYIIVGVGILFVVLNFYNLYENTLGSWDNGTVLLKYYVQGNELIIMKRSTKRSIYLQLILFSANGIYTMFTDKKMDFMMFATGNVYKSTGTTSNAPQDEELEVQHEAGCRSDPKVTV